MPTSGILRSVENVDWKAFPEKSVRRSDRNAPDKSALPLRSARNQQLVAPPRVEDDATSEVSVCSSRLSTLSRKTHSKLVPSTAELDRLYMEQKQEEVRKMRRQNEISARKAIHHPDVPKTTNVRGRCSRSATVPQEFALSAPSTPRRGMSVASDDGNVSDASDRESEWSASLRSNSARGSSTAGGRQLFQGPAQLTIPSAPRLRTSCRSRSVSRDGRGPGSCGARSREGSRDGAPAEWKASLRDAAPLTPDHRSISRGSLSQPPPRWVTPGVASLAALTHGGSSVTKADEEEWEAHCSTSGHGSSAEYFELSVESRISRLARPQSAARLRAPSTDDLEVMAAERKKRDIREQRRRNDENFRLAVTCPDRPISHSSLEATIPQEFPLSGLGAEPKQVAGAPELRDGGQHWPGSLRRSPSSDRALSTDGILPLGAQSTLQLRLTTPIGPVLRTGRRSVSGSPGRSRLATPIGTPRARSVSRSRVAASPQQVAASSAAPPELKQSSPVKVETRPSGRPLTAKERAEQARAAARANLSAQAAEKAKLCVFKPNKATATSGSTSGAASSGAKLSAPDRARARSTTWSASALSSGSPPAVGAGATKERPKLGVRPSS